jgi:arabinofuranosyltransferase
MRTYLKYFDKKLLLIFFIAVLFNTVPQFYLWNHISDDAFISFRYAERMLNGHGLTFNDGEKVEGFSSPLWIFAISFFQKLLNLVFLI